MSLTDNPDLVTPENASHVMMSSLQPNGDIPTPIFLLLPLSPYPMRESILVSMDLIIPAPFHAGENGGHGNKGKSTNCEGRMIPSACLFSMSIVFMVTNSSVFLTASIKFADPVTTNCPSSANMMTRCCICSFAAKSEAFISLPIDFSVILTQSVSKFLHLKI